MSSDPSSGSSGPDPRRRSRRRGSALTDAIYEAVLAELAERDFAEMSIERVASRAGTGKAAIYRRWPSKEELIVDTLANAFSTPEPMRSSGSLREDLLEFHLQLARALSGPVGAVLRANIGQHDRHPQLFDALRERILAPRQRNLRALLVAAVERDEAGPGALAEECIDAGPALVRQRFIESGEPVGADAVHRIVDNVLMPMLRR